MNTDIELVDKGTQTERWVKKEHNHIWKYMGPFERVCEAPFPTIPSCGRAEINSDDGNGFEWTAYESGREI